MEGKAVAADFSESLGAKASRLRTSKVVVVVIAESTTPTSHHVTYEGKDALVPSRRFSLCSQFHGFRENRGNQQLRQCSRRVRNGSTPFGEALADASDGFDLAARMIKREQRVMFSEDYDLRSLFVEKMTNVQSLSPPPGLEAHVKLVSRIKRTWFHAVERGQQDGSIRVDIPPQSLVAHVRGRAPRELHDSAERGAQDTNAPGFGDRWLRER